MYIIPYFLENEAKKLLKVKLSEFINDVTTDLLDNIFRYNSDNKYENLMLNLEKSTRKNILKVIVDTFKILDDLYLKSDDRKKQFNICVKKCHRSIVTIFGILEFDRVYYYDKNDRKKHFYFIDSLFHLPEYDRYDKIIKGIAIDNAIATNQKKGAETTSNQINSILSYLNNNQPINISRQDIYNWLDKWNVPNIEYSVIESDSDTLYIMIDEKYIHEQLKIYFKEDTKIETKTTEQIKKEFTNFMNWLSNPNKQLLLPITKTKSKNFIMSKAFITFTDIITKGKRRILNNKFTFLTTGKNPWNEFMDTIPKIFDFKKFKNIKVLSDAGSWILAGTSNLKLFCENVIIPCLCEFHVKQKINRSTKDETLRKKLWECIDNDDKTSFCSIFKTILKDKDSKRTKTLKSYRHYIISHWNSIKEMKKSKYKSSMESHISHDIAKPFSYEPKAYSTRHIQKLVKLQEYKLNGINILNLYLNSCNNQKVTTIKKEQLSFSIFDNHSSNLPALNSTDFKISHLFRVLTS